MKVLELNATVEPTKGGFGVRFEGGFGNKVGDLLSEKEMKEVRELTTKISKIVNEAIVRDVTDQLHEAIEDVKKVEEELEKLDTPEEQMMYILEKIKETISKK